MADLQLISSVFVLTVNLVCSLMLWVIGRGSRPKMVLALLSTLLVGWNLFAVLLMPDLRFDSPSFWYCMATTSGAALIYIYLFMLLSPVPVSMRQVAGLYIAPAVLSLLYLFVGPQMWLRIAAAGCFLVYFFQVVWLVARLWPRYRRRIAALYSYRERIGLGWVPFVAALFLFYGFVVVLDVFFARAGTPLPTIFNFFFAAFYLTINLIGLSQQDLPLPVESTSPEGSMTVATRLRLRHELPELMTTRKVYLDPELRLDTVAQMLGTNRTYISTVLNEALGKSFIVWVNEYRIEEAKRIMRGETGKSISAIAEQAGFKSHSSFIEFFRRVEGVGPSEYRKKL